MDVITALVLSPDTNTLMCVGSAGSMDTGYRKTFVFKVTCIDGAQTSQILEIEHGSSGRGEHYTSSRMLQWPSDGVVYMAQM